MTNSCTSQIHYSVSRSRSIYFYFFSIRDLSSNYVKWSGPSIQFLKLNYIIVSFRCLYVSSSLIKRIPSPSKRIPSLFYNLCRTLSSTTHTHTQIMEIRVCVCVSMSQQRTTDIPNQGPGGRL